MITPAYLRLLGIFSGIVLALVVLFIWIVDPYGASPLNWAIPSVNIVKPGRVDIDRQIKPCEVWLRQPTTVFLGTSRIHQSIDPSLFEGTAFAPAYNASIPASSLGMNISHLEQYAAMDRRLKHVFVELFLYNFLGQGQERTSLSATTMMRDLALLNISSSAWWQSITTLRHNLKKLPRSRQIMPGGYFLHDPSFRPQDTFVGFPEGIRALHPLAPKTLELHDPAFDTVAEFVRVAAAHDLDLAFIATPNHAFMDFYFDRVNAWPLVETWLRRVCEVAVVYSFSQPSEWMHEEPREGMCYWNDPTHFSLEMGRAIAASLAGAPPKNAPPSFMIRLTPDLVAAHVRDRREAIRKWAAQHTQFAAEFDFIFGMGPPLKSEDLGSSLRDALLIRGVRHPLVSRTAGVIERVQEGLGGLRVHARFAPGMSVSPLSLVAVVNEVVVADVIVPVDSASGSSGKCWVAVPLPANSSKSPPLVRLFAVFADGSARPISCGIPSPKSATLAAIPEMEG